MICSNSRAPGSLGMQKYWMLGRWVKRSLTTGGRGARTSTPSTSVVGDGVGRVVVPWVSGDGVEGGMALFCGRVGGALLGVAGETTGKVVEVVVVEIVAARLDCPNS